MFYFWRRIHFITRKRTGLKILELLYDFFLNHLCKLEIDIEFIEIYIYIYIYILLCLYKNPSFYC